VAVAVAEVVAHIKVVQVVVTLVNLVMVLDAKVDMVEHNHQVVQAHHVLTVALRTQDLLCKAQVLTMVEAAVVDTMVVDLEIVKVDGNILLAVVDQDTLVD
jgi:hypothetical protein